MSLLSLDDSAIQGRRATATPAFHAERHSQAFLAGGSSAGWVSRRRPSQPVPGMSLLRREDARSMVPVPPISRAQEGCALVGGRSGARSWTNGRRLAGTLGAGV